MLKTKAKMANGNVKNVRFVRSLFVSFFFYTLCSNREGDEKVIQFYAHFSSG